MDHDEWCVGAHVDIGMRDGLEFADTALRTWTDGASASPGVRDLLALKDERRPNHFEVIGRYASEDAYRSHQVTPTNLEFRRKVGPVLGSPYEDRVLAPRGERDWPEAATGEFVVVTQVEARPDRRDQAAAHLDALVELRASAAGLIGVLGLERRFLATNLEVLSVWTGADAFDAHLGAEAVIAASKTLEELLIAPIESRRFHVLARATAAT